MNTATTREAEEKQRQAAFFTTLGRVGAAWKRAGAAVNLQALTDKAPAADVLLETARKRLDSTWLTAQCNMATPADFTAALDAWEAENYNAITALKAVL